MAAAVAIGFANTFSHSLKTRFEVTPDGKVERCSEGEAQGVVDSRGRPGTRHPSGHGKEVHGSSEPAHEARSGRIGAICYHREQYK